MNLVSDKIVNIKQLKMALAEEYPLDYTDGLLQCGNAIGPEEIIRESIDEFIQENVERPALEAMGVDSTKELEDGIYDAIDNMDDFRDCINDFIKIHLQYIKNVENFSKWRKKGAKK